MALKKRKLYTQDLFEDDYDTNSKAGEPNKLRCVKEIPREFRNIFADSFLYFNEVQSKIFDDIYNSYVSLAVTAPTSSGKTVLLELGIIRLLLQAKNQSPPDFRIVYIAPTKALISEKHGEWTKKFQNVLKVTEVTGDDDIIYLEDLSEFQLILTTPEKWDSLTRRWKDDEKFLQSIKLFLIDEVHLLNDDRRGSTLEAIVTRMKLASSSQFNSPENPISQYHNIRFICISATIPNIHDVAEWIKTKNTQAKAIEINEDYRPVKLEKVVLGFPCPKQLKSFRFDINLNYKLAGVIRQFSNDKPTMIFCNSRKSIELAANVLETALKIEFSIAERNNILEIAAQLQDEQLKKLLKKGIGYHHAGLSASDRLLIENSFRSSAFAILLCTTTLSMGVNLPAHLVIIKSTEVFRKGKSEQYDDNTMLQMIGRAGRPQFDKSGTVVIMTQASNVNKYQNLVTGRLPIESNLHANLTEHLNSEIVLQTITSAAEALEWLRSTFLYVRISQNQEYYGFAKTLSKEKLDEKLQELCEFSIVALEKQGMLTKETDGLVASTVFGKIMSHFYMSFETAKLLNQLKGNESQEELLNVLTRAPEFKDFLIRNNDRKCLNQIIDDNLKPLRYPILGKIKSVDLKISCILQAVLQNLPISDYSLRNEIPKILFAAQRLTKCCIEYIRATENKTKTGIFRGLLQAVTFAKCLEAQLWENSRFVSRQIVKIGTTYCGAMVKAGLLSFTRIKNEAEIEKITGQQPPFGQEVLEYVSKLPKYEITIKKSEDEVDTVDLAVSQTNPLWDKMLFGAEAFLLVGDSKNNLLLYWDDLNFQLANGVERMAKSIKYNHGTEVIIAHVVHSRLVGVDVVATLDTKHKTSKLIQHSVAKPKVAASAKIPHHFIKKKTKKDFLNNSIITDFFSAVDRKVEPVEKGKLLPRPEIPDTPQTSSSFKPLPKPEIPDIPMKTLPRPVFLDTPPSRQPTLQIIKSSMAGPTLLSPPVLQYLKYNPITKIQGPPIVELMKDDGKGKLLPRPEIPDTPQTSSSFKPLPKPEIPDIPMKTLPRPVFLDTPPSRQPTLQIIKSSMAGPTLLSPPVPQYLKYNPITKNQGPPIVELMEDYIIDSSLFIKNPPRRAKAFEEQEWVNVRNDSITSYFQEEKKVQEPKKTMIEQMLFSKLEPPANCKMAKYNEPKPEISNFTSNIKRKLESLEMPKKPKMARSCIPLREVTKELYSPSEIDAEWYRENSNFGNFLNVPPLPEPIKTPEILKTPDAPAHDRTPLETYLDRSQVDLRNSLLKNDVYTKLDPVAQVERWNHMKLIFPTSQKYKIGTSHVFEQIPMRFRDFKNYPKFSREMVPITVEADEKIEPVVSEETKIPQVTVREIEKIEKNLTPKALKKASSMMDKIYSQHIFHTPTLNTSKISKSVVQSTVQLKFINIMLEPDKTFSSQYPEDDLKLPTTELDSVKLPQAAPKKSIFDEILGSCSKKLATQKPSIVLESVLDELDYGEVKSARTVGIFVNTPSLASLNTKFRLKNKFLNEQNWPSIVDSILGKITPDLKSPVLVNSTTIPMKRKCIPEVSHPWKRQNTDNEFGSFQKQCRPSTSKIVSPDSTSSVTSKYQLYILNKAESKEQRDQRERLATCKAKLNGTSDCLTYIKDYLNIKMINNNCK